MYRRLLHDGRIFESDDARERNEMAEGEDRVGMSGRFPKAVKHGAQPAGKWRDQREGVVERVTLVNDYVQSELCGEFELLDKGRRLDRLFFRQPLR